LAVAAAGLLCAALVTPRLVHRFGDLEGIMAATDEELSSVEGVGEARAEEIRAGLRRVAEVGFVDHYTSS
jgi:diadenylate cyclase